MVTAKNVLVVARTKTAAAPAESKATANATSVSPDAVASDAATKAKKSATKPTETVAAVSATPKTAKDKKPKLVRDSFTIPKAEYTVLDDLKQRAVGLNQPIKKSELIRAGIKALASMSDASLLAAIKGVPTIKTGRPAK